MTTAWPAVPLGEALRQRKEFIQIDDLTTYKRPRVQLHARGILVRDEVPGTLIKTKRQQVCRTGEFLVAEIDAKVGGFGIVPASLDGSLVSSHYFLFEVDETKLDRRFIDYFIRTPTFLTQVEAQGSTNYAAIRPGDVLGYTIPLPPLAEQRRAVARIEELSDQISEARCRRLEAAEEAEAIGSAGRYAVFARVGQKGSSRRLEELTSRISKGESPEWQGFAYQDYGPLFIRSENVRWGSLDAGNARHISDEFHQKLLRSQLRNGDVLINLVGASIGRSCAVPDDLEAANVNQAVAVISPTREALTSKFLVHFLLSPMAQDVIHGNKVETARPNISLANLRDLKVPAPPTAEQHRVVAILDDLQSEVDALKRVQAETASELEALFSAILDRAFKGELV